MTTATTTRTGLLNLIFVNLAYANVGDASGLQPSATAGNLYLALHTADPTISGTGSSSEANYGSYARVAVARSAGGWTVSGNTSVNTSAATFPTCTSGSNLVTYFSITVASSGASAILFYGALTNSQTISTGGTPSFASSQCVTTWST